MDKNSKTLTSILLVVAVMIGLSFASVPLYKLFCQVTGFDGTVQIGSTELPDKILERTVKVAFNADISSSLPWSFKPEKREMTVRLGQQGLIAFHAVNKSARATTGTAIYNVTPEKVGQYFHKTQCFCFAEQTLTPGQDMQMPVVFYIDPAMAEDKSMEDVKAITLSYTFFPAESKELDQAMEDFQNR